jgi:hypothetical protein
VQWRFFEWFSGLTDSEAEEYQRRYPEPPEWQGKYAEYRRSNEG